MIIGAILASTLELLKQIYNEYKANSNFVKCLNS